MGPILFLLFLVVVITGPYLSRLSREHKEKMMAANISDPILVIAESPLDTTVHERGQWWKDAIEQSGNKWKPPVLVFPFDGVYNVKDINGATGSFLHMNYRQYVIKCLELYQLECERWQKEVIERHGVDVMNRTTAGQTVKGSPRTISWNPGF